MSKIRDLIERAVQFTTDGKHLSPTGSTTPTLEAGIYKVGTDMSGRAWFTKHDLVTDELYRFEDERHQLVLEEIEQFWKLESKFKNLGFTHKRGMLLHGKPGSGKSALLKLVMEDITKAGDIVLLARDLHSLRSVLGQMREIEPDRKCVVVMEDVDELIRYGEHALLELFDGDDQVDKVLYLGTTNYPERLPNRVRRAGRFDRSMEIPFPPKAGRLAYLEKKIGLFEKEDPAVVDDIAEATDGFSFAQLKEFLVSTYIYGYDPEVTITRLQSAIMSESKVTDLISTDVKMFQLTAEQKASLRRMAERIKTAEHRI